MSGEAPAAVWQRPELVEEFLAERSNVLPLLDVQEELVRTIFRRDGRRVGRFLDIGAGDGAMSELLLDALPGSEALLVDFSEPMLTRAGVRLGRLQGRWSTARADLRDPRWHEQVPPGPYDAAVSSFAVHHLTAERKRALFAEVFALLAPGALLVNMDVVTVQGPLAGLFDETMAAGAVHAEHARGGTRSDHEVATELLADDGEDRPDSAESQIAWLREAGFADVELHFKWAEGAIFGARRP
ncbi:MAG TPA: methyltransferase [Solirubrobacteraceae bacterium]|nr:methyltransferase [Solirubrobacteraceae bacterium]